VDDELRRIVPYALKDMVLEDGARVVAVVGWDRDAEAFMEPTTSRAFVIVRARVLAMLVEPGQVSFVLPRIETDKGTSASAGAFSALIRGASCAHFERVLVRFVKKNRDDVWEADIDFEYSWQTLLGTNDTVP
jgi:hypothetical protein